MLIHTYIHVNFCYLHIVFNISIDCCQAFQLNYDFLALIALAKLYFALMWLQRSLAMISHYIAWQLLFYDIFCIELFVAQRTCLLTSNVYIIFITFIELQYYENWVEWISPTYEMFKREYMVSEKIRSAAIWYPMFQHWQIYNNLHLFVEI